MCPLRCHLGISLFLNATPLQSRPPTGPSSGFLLTVRDLLSPHLAREVPRVKVPKWKPAPRMSSSVVLFTCRNRMEWIPSTVGQWGGRGCRGATCRMESHPLRMDPIHFAQPASPWKDLIPRVNACKQWFLMGSMKPKRTPFAR